MKNIKRIVPIIALVLLVTACASIYTATVTITQVVDAGMKDWAALSVAGKTSPAIDAAVVKGHDKYRAACAVAQTALIAYKASGDQSQYIAALSATRAAAQVVFDIITPFLSSNEAVNLNTKLQKAVSL